VSLNDDQPSQGQTGADFPGFDVQQPYDVTDETAADQPSRPTTPNTPNMSRFQESIAKLRRSPKLTGAKRSKAAEGLAEFAGMVVKRAGIALHNRRTPHDVLDNSIWYATAEEAEAIAAPIGRILARTLPGVIAAFFAAGEGAVGDGMAVVDGIKEYVQPNLIAEAEYAQIIGASSADPGKAGQGPPVDL
jgi:hypothetical protein